MGVNLNRCFPFFFDGVGVGRFHLSVRRVRVNHHFLDVDLNVALLSVPVVDPAIGKCLLDPVWRHHQHTAGQQMRGRSGESFPEVLLGQQVRSGVVYQHGVEDAVQADTPHVANVVFYSGV